MRREFVEGLVGVLVSNLDAEQLAGALLAVLDIMHNGDEGEIIARVAHIAAMPFDKAPIN